MDPNEIMAELPKLSRKELEMVDRRVHELLQASEKTVWENLLDIAGTAEGQPEDMARQHDHYLHGTPKR